MVRTLAVLFALSVFAPIFATAQTGTVGLGVGAGIVTRHGADDLAGSTSFSWGFHVDIPIIASLHVAPSAVLYRDAGIYATDIALSFRFMIPLRRVDLYLGIAPGVSASGTTVSPHLGALGGVTLPLVSNVRGYAQYRYTVTLGDEAGAEFSRVSAGLLLSL